MCGLAGVLNAGRDPAAAALLMADAIRHRGPDDSGVWSDEAARFAIGFRRLAIIDTSQAGHQPMVSADGRHVLAFNGEIYNHLDLRAELAAAGAAPAWRGHSDTETLLAGIARWGLSETLKRAAGMFALAVWDRHERVLELARDRLGEKPLYYGWAGPTFLFGSELKAISAYPGFAPRMSREALAQYLRFAYVPSPLSSWEGIFKLEPGVILTVSGDPPPLPFAAPLRPGSDAPGLSMRRYWSLAEVAEKGCATQIESEADAVQSLEATLTAAVRGQMMADVPLGAFLSGGIDSSLIVALMQKASAAPVNTFTIGFDEEDFDESRHAAAVARHLGTSHTEIRVTAAEARAVIPRMPQLFDEPFADASQVPTFLVCQAARAHVTVALTGDGGDELFGGYPRYQRAPELWRLFNAVPFGLRRALGEAAGAIPAAWWDGLANLDRMGRKPEECRQVGDRMHRLAARLGSVRSPDDLYLNLVSSWVSPAGLMADPPPDADQPSLLLADPPPAALAGDFAARMMYEDALTYMADDILCKVDRAAMGVSLETRAPLLDKDVVAMAQRLTPGMRIRGDKGKWILRQILYRHVPEHLIERPKRGFFLPVGQWLRGPLRDWAEALLDPARIRNEGHLRAEPVRRAWEDHVSGRRDLTLQVWTILMFQAWAEANLAPRA